MRKRQRYITNGILGGAFAFVILDGINQYLELKEEGKPFWDNLDVNRSIKAGGKGLILGGAAGYLLYQLLQWEEKKLSFFPDHHLYNVLNTHSANQDPQYVKKAKMLIGQLKEAIAFEFNDILVGKPIDFGSEKTKTAIQFSDFDIMVPFKKGSGTMIELYDEIYDFIEANYHHDCFDFRKQRHSIGLTYDNKKMCIHFDIVPAKERNNYHETGDVTIIKRGKYFWELPKRIKSNIWIKRKNLVNQPETRQVIKLMKIYRDTSSIQFKSPVIVALVKEAFRKNNNSFHTSIYNNWLLAMAYIADQLYTRQRIVDPANSNNNLLEKMSTTDRETVANLILSDLERLEQSPHYLKEIFKI